MNTEAVLVHPPFWDMYGPPASTAALLGHLRENGVPASQFDLNQLYFRREYDNIVSGAMNDLADPDIFVSKVPHEHKVVLNASHASCDLLTDRGIDDDQLSFESHRSAIASWDIGRLNTWDAVVHYGYFVRQAPAVVEILHNQNALEAPMWRSLREIFTTTVLRHIRDNQPQVVGFSLLGEQQLAAAIACTAWLREEYDGLIVWGGSEIRYTHDKMQDQRAWWRELPNFICLGEGETAIVELAKRSREFIQPGTNWTESFPFSRNPRDREFIAGLLPRPFTRSLLPAKRYEQVNTLAQYDFDGFDLHNGYLMPYPVVPYQSSRGCHWGICAFCDHEEGYRLHYRPKDIERVVDQMEQMRDRFGIKNLQFVDEALEPDWLVGLNAVMDQHGLSDQFRWSNYSKIATEVTPQLIADSYRNGCRLILFGVETFNQRLLNVVRKGVRRNEIFRTLRDVNAAGIRSWIWLISGLPTETPENLRQNIEDLRSLRGVVDAVSVGRYRISANSDIFRDADKFGIVSYDLNHPMDVTFHLDGDLIDPAEMARLFYEEYYPTAVGMSVSHNRYLLFADAIKAESDPVQYAAAASLGRRKPSRIDIVQTTQQAGLGNI